MRRKLMNNLNIESIISSEWLEYCTKAWIYKGNPIGLSPQLIFSDPLQYDHACYHWLENKYKDELGEMFMELQVGAEIIKTSSQYFKTYWQKYFYEAPLWRQIIYFLVFADLYGGINSEILKTIRFYSLGLGIPGVALDKVSDRASNDIKEIYNTFCFTIMAFNKSILMDEISKDVLQCYCQDVEYMLNLFWAEINSRYDMSCNKNINDYIYNNDSRLCVAIYIPLAVKFLYKLKKMELPLDLSEALFSLSKVRQLNDEIVDIHEDIESGILTFPYVYALNNSSYFNELSNEINLLWERNKIKEYSKKHSRRIHEILLSSGSFDCSAYESLKLLNSSTTIFRKYFSSETIFELSLLINMRIAHLIRLRNNNWEEISQELIYQPRFSK